MVPCASVRFGLPGERPAIVLFDLGGVVVDVDLDRGRRIWTARFGTPSFDAALLDSGLKDAMDVGRTSGSSALAQLAAHGFDQSGVLAAWNGMLTVRPPVVDLARRLSADVRCAVLSNTDPLHAAWIEAMTGLDGAISSWTYSFQVGLLKPDPAIFEATLDRLDAVAPEVVLVDDRADNIAAAIELGMGGVLYTSFEAVCEALRELGLPA